MPVATKSQAKTGFDPFGLIAKYFGYIFWITVVICVIIMWPWLKKYLAKMKASVNKTEDEIEKDKLFAENSNPVTLQGKLDKITQRADVQAAARSLASDLGTIYDTGSWTDIFNPKEWTENDTSVADTLIKQRANYTYLQKMYFIITRSHSLTDDILNLLDPGQLKRVRQYINI